MFGVTVIAGVRIAVNVTALEDTVAHELGFEGSIILTVYAPVEKGMKVPDVAPAISTPPNIHW